MTNDPWRVPDSDRKDQQDAFLRPDSGQHTHPVVRLVLFLLGIALLLFGLSLAIPVSIDIYDPYLIRAMIILVIFGGAAAFWSRSSILRLFKVAGIWVIIIAGISVFYLYRSDFGERFMSAVDPAGIKNTDEGLIIHRARDGHFWLRGEINGVPILMMVDTGASNVVLSPDDARRIGIDLEQLSFSGRAATANGSVEYAHAQVSTIALGPAVFSNVPVTVNSADMGGSLLGMAVLNKFSSVEFRGNTLILRQ